MAVEAAFTIPGERINDVRFSFTAEANRNHHFFRSRLARTSSRERVEAGSFEQASR